MRYCITFLALALLLLSACGGDLSQTGLTPMPHQDEIEDKKLVEAVDSFIQKRGAPPNSVYDFVRVDLNSDEKRDGIVLFKLPHTYWCGWDGCGMVIFKAGDKSFTPISTVGNVRGPIYVRDKTTKGWRDIIIRISGINMPDKNISLEFDGRTYPQSPLLAPTLHVPPSAMSVETFFK